VSPPWADADRDYPLHAEPYTPARRLPKGKADAAFRTKPQMAFQLIEAALEMDVLFRAMMADSAYGENPPLTEELAGEDLPYGVSVKPSTGIWAPWTLCIRHRERRRNHRGVEQRSPAHGSQSCALFGMGTRRGGGLRSSCMGPMAPSGRSAALWPPPIQRNAPQRAPSTLKRICPHPIPRGRRSRPSTPPPSRRSSACTACVGGWNRVTNNSRTSWDGRMRWCGQMWHCAGTGS
jgi:hypothetical protein